MKKNLLLGLILFIPMLVMGQGPSLLFDSTSHYFNTINEDDGPVTFRFIFKNAGIYNLSLTKVETTCQCTSANWIKDSVSPGKYGYIDATFDVKGHGGMFNKSIAVYASNNEKAILTISGQVIPHINSLVDSFPYRSGNIRFKSRLIRLVNLKDNITDTFQYLRLINTSDSVIKINSLNNKGALYIFANNLPFILPPHVSMRFPVHYKANKVKDYGIVSNTVSLITTDTQDPEKVFTVLADIHKYIPKLTKDEIRSSPKIIFDDTLHDFGKVKQGEIVTFEFKYENKGSQKLDIYAAKTSCGCTVSEPNKFSLLPGENGFIKVSFDSRGKSGRDVKSITVYSNDPVKPESILSIISNVVSNSIK